MLTRDLHHRHSKWLLSNRLALLLSIALFQHQALNVTAFPTTVIPPSVGTSTRRRLGRLIASPRRIIQVLRSGVYEPEVGHRRGQSAARDLFSPCNRDPIASGQRI